MTRKRSKIRSKTRSDSSQKSEDEVLYCICRTSDGTRFMIACDHCEEWYHGDCINVTPKQANNIKRFFCHLCIGRNPSLEIEYKTIKENRPRLPNLRQQIKKINFSSEDENDADLSSTSTPEKSFSANKAKRTIRKRSRPSLSESVKSAAIKKRRGRPKEKPDDYDDEATEDEIETSGFVPPMNDCSQINLDEPIDNLYGKKSFRNQIISNNNSNNNVSNNSNSFSRNSYMHSSSIDGGSIKMCGNCDGCKMISNCGKCDVCVKKLSGNNMNSRSICRKRLCIRELKYQHQYHKDYNTQLLDDDYESVLDETGFGRQDIRSRSDYGVNEIRQRVNANPSYPNKELTTVGSKMRRGDHLPGGGNSASLRRGLNTTTVFGGESLEVTNGTSFRYRTHTATRLSRNQNTPQHQRRPRPQSEAAQMSSNTSSVSGQLSPRQYNQYADESDEDVMIPGEIISPTNGQRRTLSEIDSRNYTSYNQQQQQRIGKSTVNSETRKYHYGLSYPDHLYCKHHRYYNWHSSVSGDSISPDITNCKAEPNLKLSDKEGEIISHSHIRSPSLEQQLSPTNYIVLDRSVKQAQISSTGIRHKSQIKSNNSIANDRHDVSESFVTLYTESNQAYPIIDLNQQITSGIPLNSSAQLTLESSNPHSTSVFNKISMGNVHRQEFYTINDEDDLEINWPKETVNV